MSTRPDSYEVQARRRVRRDGGPVHDETRLANASALDDAFRAARTFADDGFTVWIYRVTFETGMRPSYRRVEVLGDLDSADSDQPIRPIRSAGFPGEDVSDEMPSGRTAARRPQNRRSS